MRQFLLDYSRIPVVPSLAFPDRRSTPRPLIALELLNGTNRLKCYGLIDSGADDCIFTASFAALLGLRIPNARSYRYGGAGSEDQEAYFFDLHVEIIAIGKLTLPIGFSPAMDKFGCGLLGQNGFFSQVAVSFNLPARNLTLTLP